MATFERKGARVAEWAGLEIRCTVCRTVGSNPTLSAIDSKTPERFIFSGVFICMFPDTKTEKQA